MHSLSATFVSKQDLSEQLDDEEESSAEMTELKKKLEAEINDLKQDVDDLEGALKKVQQCGNVQATWVLIFLSHQGCEIAENRLASYLHLTKNNAGCLVPLKCYYDQKINFYFSLDFKTVSTKQEVTQVLKAHFRLTGFSTICFWKFALLIVAMWLDEFQLWWDFHIWKLFHGTQ